MNEPSGYPGTPRWVKVVGVIALVVVLLVLILLVTGGPGEHGPRRHLSSGDAGGGPPLASVPHDPASSRRDAGGHLRRPGGR